ncbi:unnamed protein product [Closterium sp. NIES-65]|nr:unnamed protein product [Closterium sp. NIES-65]
MVDGAARIVDGAARIVDGAARIVDGAAQIVDGAARIVDGAARIVDGAARIVDGAARIVDGAARIVDGAARIVDGAARIVDGAARIVDGAAWIVDGAARIVDGATQIVDWAARIVDGAARIVDGAARIVDDAARIVDGAARIVDGAARIVDLTSLSTGVIVGIAVGCFAGFTLLASVLAWLLWPRGPKKWEGLDACEQFSLQQMVKATKNWSEDNVLGKGGFGIVYKGHSPQGQLWAIKRSTVMTNDFEIEVRAMASLHHTHLVRLLGFCLDQNVETGKQEQILVYEFVGNRDLQYNIYRTKSKLRYLHNCQAIAR